MISRTWSGLLMKSFFFLIFFYLIRRIVINLWICIRTSAAITVIFDIIISFAISVSVVLTLTFTLTVALNVTLCRILGPCNVLSNIAKVGKQFILIDWAAWVPINGPEKSISYLLGGLIQSTSRSSILEKVWELSYIQITVFITIV